MIESTLFKGGAKLQDAWEKVIPAVITREFFLFFRKNIVITINRRAAEITQSINLTYAHMWILNSFPREYIFETKSHFRK